MFLTDRVRFEETNIVFWRHLGHICCYSCIGFFQLQVLEVLRIVLKILNEPFALSHALALIQFLLALHKLLVCKAKLVYGHAVLESRIGIADLGLESSRFGLFNI